MGRSLWDEDCRSSRRIHLDEQGAAFDPTCRGTGLVMAYKVTIVNEPVRQPDDLDVDAAAFWLDTDLESMLATVKPYEGPDQFVIEDLTDDEWDRFVAALSE